MEKGGRRRRGGRRNGRTKSFLGHFLLGVDGWTNRQTDTNGQTDRQTDEEEDAKDVKWRERVLVAR